jgi:hypothetical protein
VRPLRLYGVAFVLMLAAGIALVASVRGFLASTRLLWCSMGFSVAAIVIAIMAAAWRPHER